MAIRQEKYIDITSGVGGKSAVSTRELIARIFTPNPLCKPKTVYEFNDADSVMQFFGASSIEYKHATRYFGFVTKNISKAKKISFFRHLANDINASVESTLEINDYSANGNIVMSLTTSGGGESYDIPMDLGEYDNVNDVANALLLKIQPTVNCTVDVVDGKYIKVSVTTLADGTSARVLEISFSGDVADTIGISANSNPNVAVYVQGLSPMGTASLSDSISDNYGSFYFVGSTITKEEAREVALWNKTKNYKYLYIVGRTGYTNDNGVLVGDVKEWADKDSGIGGITGSALYAYKTTSDCIEAIPAALFATTDYSRANTTKTFMYQQEDAIPAAITNDANANELDALYVNYMGVTQSAGGLIQFIQNGFNMDGVDTAVYCNEVWMKASFWTAIMNLFLAVEKVPANDDGAGQIKTVMMDTITTALRNGTIQPRKNLTITQKVYIGQVLNDTEAWKNVFNDGYVLDIVIEPVNDQYIAKYILVYSKGDAIRKVEGSDILI
jgi:hypothetical protein